MLDASFWNFMRSALNGGAMDSNQTVFIVHCRHCSTQSQVTVRDLKLDTLEEHP